MGHRGGIGWSSFGTAIAACLLCLAWAASPSSAVTTLPDGRGWEMVSPVEKNGGQIALPGALAGGGVLQSAAGGSAVTYGSGASFGPEAAGAPPASQYVSRRGASGWTTENVTAPLFSGSYGLGDEGVPYQLFSAELSLGLLLSGRRCRDEGTDCPVANPPLSPGAPAGYQNYYLRDTGTGAYEALLGAAAAAESGLDPSEFELAFAGASPDLDHVALSTCAALTPEATEVPLSGGCDPAATNLYLWSGGTLGLVNLLPGQTQGTPGAALAAQSFALSSDGARVYWSDGTDLYLRANGETRQVDAGAGGGGTFETASASGSVAFYTKGGHLYRYEAAGDSSLDLTPAGGVLGVLGASADGSHVYYVTAAGILLRRDAETVPVAPAADAVNYPPTTGTARVSADGTKLVFLRTIETFSQVHVYDSVANKIVCASCRATATKPLGPSTVPGAIANGAGPAATRSYKPRALTADGGRLFFDTRDKLVTADTNNDWDVYEWQALGTGGCTKPKGCVALISSGTAAGGASFVDASADGSDAFFLTDGSLVKGDPGAVDLYDARVGGGFPVPPDPIPCIADACQPLPPEPPDPTLTTTVKGLGNPPVQYFRPRSRCTRKQVRRHGKCVKRPVRQGKSGQKGRPGKRGAR
jgi:hypothetical protein